MTERTRNDVVRDYVAAFAGNGSSAFIENLDTTVGLSSWGDHLLPVTINDGAPARTFVCSPRVGYIDYPREELARFPTRALVTPLRAIIDGVGLIASSSLLDRVVHINNWMMSTNLPVCLDPTLASARTEQFADSHPDHLLAIRSLTRRHNGRLINALLAAGWKLLPSRQVFLVDDVARETSSRRDSRRDHALWQAGHYAYEQLQTVDTADADRIVELYNQLYRQKYSCLNPAYTSRFITLTHAIGMIGYLVLRDQQGVIQAFGGMHRFGEYATMPMIGYNLDLPQQQGLYRLICHAGSLYAARHRLKLNMLSGATAFKRSRGATAEMEFTAFYLRHLPAPSRARFGLLRLVADHVGMPVLKRYQL